MRPVLLVIAVLFGLSAVASAQSASPPHKADDELDFCLGFSFGSWKPALDWVEAGHQSIDTTRLTKAPGGRDWATSGAKTEGDTTFILFPMWWPAGVVVSLEHVPHEYGDTTKGKANALVADARKTSPTSLIRAWKKSCGG